MRRSSARGTPSRPAVLALALVAVVGIALAAGGSAGASTAKAPDPSAKRAKSRHTSVLMALEAKNADAAQVADGYRVTLTGYGDVLLFTDRPVRKARRTRVALLAAGWPRLFGKDAPNAALSGITSDGKSVDVAVELTAINGDDHAVAFDLRGVGADRNLHLPAHLDDVSLFIDDASLDATELVFASTFVPFDSSF